MRRGAGDLEVPTPIVWGGAGRLGRGGMEKEGGGGRRRVTCEEPERLGAWDGVCPGAASLCGVSVRLGLGSDGTEY